MNTNYFGIIMAGGVGARFWPVSTAKKPKQFRDLLGKGETLIQTTFRRLSAIIPRENIYVLTNREYRGLVQKQLPDVNPEQVVEEPVMRNTAPAVLLASLKINKRHPGAQMLMAPSDHWIEDESAFSQDVKHAFEACSREDHIITLGINPTFPNTGYGYINYTPGQEGKVKKVHRFTEKPHYEQASQFLKGGDYLWNAGIFVWNTDHILRAFQNHLPDMYQHLHQGLSKLNSPEEVDFIAEVYPELDNISIDYGILEKEEDSVHVIPATFDWNDLGTWGSLYEESHKDAQDNAGLNVRLHAENATGNLISSPDGKVVVIDGLKDYIIVDENEVLLIVPRGKEQEIKEIRRIVKEKFGDQLG